MDKQFHFEIKFDIGDLAIFEGKTYIVLDFEKVSPYMGYKYLLKGLNKWVYETLLTKIQGGVGNG